MGLVIFSQHYIVSYTLVKLGRGTFSGYSHSGSTYKYILVICHPRSDLMNGLQSNLKQVGNES